MTRGGASLAGIGSGRDWLAADLLRVEEILTSTAGSSPHPLVSEPALHLLKAGGKRLRPALVLLSSHAGEQGRRSTDLAAAAIELVHIATLYHDDVLDETDARRGVPTAHSKWGTEIAILAGDFLFACGSALGAEASGEVPGILARAIAEVCEGEIVETAASGNPLLPAEDYLETIRLKTAALFRAACDLGGATSDAGPSKREALLSYGENLGLAFQVVDDLLDLVGDPHVTGKNRGTDVAAGVFTLPILYACDRDPTLAGRLAAGERTMETILPALEAVGAIDAALAAAEDYGRRARAAVAELGVGEWAEAMDAVVQGVLAQVEPRRA